MKQLTPRISCALVVMIALIFVACSKDGPKGDTGPAGPAGPAGATGATGPKGDTGVANVIYSDWFDVKFKPDTVHNGAVIDTVGYYSDISIPKLTNAILNNGDMRMYVNLNTSTTPNVQPLPYTDIIFSGVSIVPTFFLNGVEVYSNADASTQTLPGNVKRYQERYILIPGGVHARSSIDWNDYNQVKKYLNLPD